MHLLLSPQLSSTNHTVHDHRKLGHLPESVDWRLVSASEGLEPLTVDNDQRYGDHGSIKEIRDTLRLRFDEDWRRNAADDVGIGSRQAGGIEHNAISTDQFIRYFGTKNQKSMTKYCLWKCLVFKGKKAPC